MIRRFKILDTCNKKAYMGEMQYNTETERFRVLVLDDYTNKNPDPFMKKYAGQKELHDYMVDRWINRRVMPPTRHCLRSILNDIGLKEYNVFDLLMVTKGVCDMDPFIFEEITK